MVYRNKFKKFKRNFYSDHNLKQNFEETAIQYNFIVFVFFKYWALQILWRCVLNVFFISFSSPHSVHSQGTNLSPCFHPEDTTTHLR